MTVGLGLEDVDLVAEERTMPGMGRDPLLCELLNEMEAMAEDADVSFLLTDEPPRHPGAGLGRPPWSRRPRRAD